MGNATYCAPRILANGFIERDSSKQFLAFLAAARRSDQTLPPKPAVCFNSPGGDLQGGLALGRAIRQQGLDTCLAPTYSRVIPATGGDEETFLRNVVCASACAFAMLGGQNRLIEPHSRYGVHQFSGARGNIGDSSTQVAVVVLAAYLEEMAIGRALLDMASLVPPQKIRWLTPDELRTFGVDNMTVVASRWKLDALQDGTVVASISLLKPGSQNRVSLSLLRSEGLPVLLVALTPGQRGSKSLQEAIEAVKEEPLTLLVDGREVAIAKTPRWRIVRESLLTEMPLNPNAVNRLRTGKVLSLEVPMARAYAHYDPSIEVSLEQTASIFAAALR